MTTRVLTRFGAAALAALSVLVVRPEVAGAGGMPDFAESETAEKVNALLADWKVADAEALLAAELKGSPDDAELHHLLGVTRATAALIEPAKSRKAVLKKAIEAFEKALAIDAARSDTRIALIDAYIDAGQPKDADKLVLAAIAADGESPALVARRGRLHLANKRVKEAVTDLRACATSGSGPEIRLWLGQALLANKEADAAWPELMAAGKSAMTAGAAAESAAVCLKSLEKKKRTEVEGSLTFQKDEVTVTRPPFEGWEFSREKFSLTNAPGLAITQLVNLRSADGKFSVWVYRYDAQAGGTFGGGKTFSPGQTPKIAEHHLGEFSSTYMRDASGDKKLRESAVGGIKSHAFTRRDGEYGTKRTDTEQHFVPFGSNTFVVAVWAPAGRLEEYRWAVDAVLPAIRFAKAK